MPKKFYRIDPSCLTICAKLRKAMLLFLGLLGGANSTLLVSSISTLLTYLKLNSSLVFTSHNNIAKISCFISVYNETSFGEATFHFSTKNQKLLSDCPTFSCPRWTTYPWCPWRSWWTRTRGCWPDKTNVQTKVLFRDVSNFCRDVICQLSRHIISPNLGFLLGKTLHLQNEASEDDRKKMTKLDLVRWPN